MVFYLGRWTRDEDDAAGRDHENGNDPSGVCSAEFEYFESQSPLRYLRI